MATQKESHRVILVTATSGHHLNQWTQELLFWTHSNLPDVKLIDEITCVEDFISDALETLISKNGWKVAKPPSGFGLKDILRKFPFDEVVKICQEALRIALENLKKKLNTDLPSGGYAIVTLHPVLFTHRTREFVEPYNASLLSQLATELEIEIKRIISIHDDIYDIYRRLMDASDLFHPRITRDHDLQKRYFREPERDLAELMLVLSWRDRELANSRSLAAHANIPHLLFHRKGRMDCLSKHIFDNKKIIYFSHPISQPRRDILKIPVEGKCSDPNPSRGRELIRKIKLFADRLSEISSIIEPTAIDEYRVDIEGFNRLNETFLREMILPSVTERWPIGGGKRLEGGADEHTIERDGRLLVKEEVFEDFHFDDSTAIKIKSLKPLCNILKNEIKRQIGVRDYVLSEQADIVLAYRPFSLPDSADPTGGVEKEMIAIQRIMQIRGLIQKPSLIIMHPNKDEVRRRLNAFSKFWKKQIHKRLEKPNSKEAEKLQKNIIELLKNWKWHPEQFENLDRKSFSQTYANILSSLSAIIGKSKVNFIFESDTSSMQEEGKALVDAAKDDFTEYLVSKTDVFFPQLIHEMKNDDNLESMVKFLDSDELNVSISNKIIKMINN